MGIVKVLEIHCDSCFKSVFGGKTEEDVPLYLEIYGWEIIEGDITCPACLADMRNEPEHYRTLERKEARARKKALQALREDTEARMLQNPLTGFSSNPGQLDQNRDSA